MTQSEAGKLPQHLQKQEDKLVEALTNLRAAYELAIRVDEQLRNTLHSAKQTLEENNY